MRTRATTPKIEAHWLKASTTPQVMLVRERRGHLHERVLGPRGRLELHEAAALLCRPRSSLLGNIRAGFLTARRDGRRVFVTVAALHRFLEEEREDGEAARAAIEEMRRTGQKPIPAEQVHRELGLE